MRQSSVVVASLAIALTSAGCASGNLREAEDVLKVSPDAGLVEHFPMPAAQLAAALPSAAERAGWVIERNGGADRPWIIELPWGFNEAGIWARVVIVDGTDHRCSMRVTAITKNDVDRAEDVEGNTRLLVGWIIVTAQGRLAARER